MEAHFCGQCCPIPLPLEGLLPSALSHSVALTPLQLDGVRLLSLADGGQSMVQYSTMNAPAYH